MNLFKRLFTRKKKKKQEPPKEPLDSKTLEQLNDMPSTLDFRFGRASEMWKKYHEKWGK